MSGRATYCFPLSLQTYPCPTCKAPNALTYREHLKGYQCSHCADLEEFGAPRLEVAYAYAENLYEDFNR